MSRYLTGLTDHTGEAGRGAAWTVLPWQRRFLRGAFAPGVGTAALSIARGNGKTALLSAVACATLEGPLAVPRSETVIVASSFGQACLAFEHVMAFMGERALDRSRYRLWQSGQLARIQHRETGAMIRCLGSDPRRAHGLAPSLILADEPSQWPPATGERMLAALMTALGKIPNARFVALGTRPAGTDHWFAKMLAGTADYAQSHAAPPGDPPFRRRTWAKANPSLDFMPDLESTIRREAGHARTDPTMFPTFRALRLNGGTADHEVSMLLDAATWEGIEGESDRAGPATWGCDLGTNAAMSAIAAFWPETGRLESVAAFPVEPSLAERGLRDGVGGLYQNCCDRGELIQTGQRAVSIGGLLAEAFERFGRPARIVADRWREAELRDALDAAGVPPAALEIRGMGFKDGGEDVRGFRRAVLEGRVTPARSLLLRYAMAEARVVTDPAGNAKLAKSTEGGRRAKARDDAAAAAILAVAAGTRQSARPPARRRRHALVG